MRVRVIAWTGLIWSTLAGSAVLADTVSLVAGDSVAATDPAPRALFALPGQTVELHSVAPGGAADVGASIGYVEAADGTRWRWRAPESPGAFGEIVVADPARPDLRTEINLFVLVPVSELAEGYVGGYRIDAYPDGRPADNNADYSPPAGFIEVTQANADRHVSPNFRIGQFVSKQAGDWPKYVAPGPVLYSKLEQLLAAVRAHGYPAETLHIMSGYRTPYYNRAIGNVPFSRHIYGDAADVFVDIDSDGNMDDLNGDGQVGVADAVTLAGWLDAITTGLPDFSPLIGGLGIYDSTPYHGPFVHLDARGYRARWGLWPK